MFEGQADVWIGDAHVTLTPGQFVVVPAGRKHRFANSGTTVPRIRPASPSWCSTPPTTTSAKRRAVVAGFVGWVRREAP